MLAHGTVVSLAAARTVIPDHPAELAHERLRLRAHVQRRVVEHAAQLLRAREHGADVGVDARALPGGFALANLEVLRVVSRP